MAKSKISTTFSARLRRLGQAGTIRAIVLLEHDRTAVSVHTDRAQAIDALRESASNALSEIDRILTRFDGRRLADQPNALGYVPVETTAAGLRALAESDHVRAVIEDQPISLAR
jgi:hypothetical protein